jgi:hypothetical protein
MSDWLDGYRHTQRWLKLAAQLEGLIEAHKVLKAGNGDVFDEQLWRLADDVSKEADDAGL